jgi:hypothetical protein
MSVKWVHRFERKPGRWVFQPSDEARAEGAEVKALIEAHWRLPRYYYHLREGGHVAALRKHQRSELFIKADVADFFGSVSRSRICRLLKADFGHKEALRMATASTVRHPEDPQRRMLPYGFIQSPLLASLAMSRSALGALLERLHRERGLVVTVYVDDIIVSGRNVERLQEVLGELKVAAARSRLFLNESKEHGPSPVIEVFNIKLAVGHELEVLPGRLNDFARILAASTSPQKRNGILGYVSSVNFTQALALASLSGGLGP